MTKWSALTTFAGRNPEAGSLRSSSSPIRYHRLKNSACPCSASERRFHYPLEDNFMRKSTILRYLIPTFQFIIVAILVQKDVGLPEAAIISTVTVVATMLAVHWATR